MAKETYTVLTPMDHGYEDPESGENKVAHLVRGAVIELDITESEQRALCGGKSPTLAKGEVRLKDEIVEPRPQTDPDTPPEGRGPEVPTSDQVGGSNPGEVPEINDAGEYIDPNTGAPSAPPAADDTPAPSAPEGESIVQDPNAV